MFEQITILGPGLLGASLAIAVKERGLVRRVTVWSRRHETRVKSVAQPWCDTVAETAEEAVAGSDLVLICTPVETILPLLERIRGKMAPGTLVTDVGSTKSGICREAGGLLSNGAAFIGSHPMAGSENTGMEHARSDLFERAACILTPVDDTPADGLARIRAFWEALGMVLFTMAPEQHDEIVAHVSHLPHILAASLCGCLSAKDPAWGSLSGGGLRDTTRIASGDPRLWQQILEQNREEVLRAIHGFEKELLGFKSALQNKDPAETIRLLDRGKNYRDRLNS